MARIGGPADDPLPVSFRNSIATSCSPRGAQRPASTGAASDVAPPLAVQEMTIVSSRNPDGLVMAALPPSDRHFLKQA